MRSEVEVEVEVLALPGSDLSLREQRRSRRVLTSPQTIWEVATSPPTLAHSPTANWTSPSLSLVTETLKAARSYLK